MKKICSLFLMTIILCCFCACGGDTSVGSTSGTSTNGKSSKEDFNKEYDMAIMQFELLSVCSADVISKNLEIWDQVGPDSVSYSIECIRAYEINGQDDDWLIRHIVFSYGYDYYIQGDKERALHKADEYGESYKLLLETIKLAENTFKSIKQTYGDSYDISDLKAYYVEVSSFADLAVNLKGSYMSYSSDANTYLNNIEKLKKNAELAY